MARLPRQRQASLHQPLCARVIALIESSHCQETKQAGGIQLDSYLEVEIHSLFEVDDRRSCCLRLSATRPALPSANAVPPLSLSSRNKERLSSSSSCAG